jgi:hypothetical protein
MRLRGDGVARWRSQAGTHTVRQSLCGHTCSSKSPLIAIALACVPAACGQNTAAPVELEGLWSSSLEACSAGLGVTFRRDAVRARFGGETFVLLSEPRYEVRSNVRGVRIRINYRLPAAPGGVNSALGRGIVELERSRTGRLRPVARWFADMQTGSVRAALAPDALDEALDLGLCPRDTPKPAAA